MAAVISSRRGQRLRFSSDKARNCYHSEAVTTSFRQALAHDDFSLDRVSDRSEKNESESMADLSPQELLARGFSRETTIRRDARGRWFSDGDLITHAKLAHAFDTWVDVAEDGRFCLKNSIHWVYVDLIGAPIFVRSLRVNARGIPLLLSDDREEELRLETLRADGHGLLYCTVRDGKMCAQFDTHAACQLSDLLEETEAGAVLRVNGAAHLVPTVSNPLSLK